MKTHNSGYLSRPALRRLGFAELGENVLIHPTCVIVGCDRILIGSHVRIDPFCIITATSRLTIGTRVHISGHVTIVAAAGIDIGDFAAVSHGVRILSSTDHFSSGGIAGPMTPLEFRDVISKPIRIGRHAILGTNSVVLPGGSLGAGATVGALSLVKKTLRPWTVNAGIPARVIGMRDRTGVLAMEESLLNRDLKVSRGPG